MAEDNLNTAAGCRIGIGSKNGADTEALYKADTYVDIGEVEDLGEFGDTFSSVTFTSLRDGRVRKYKGTADAGDLTLAVGLDNGDLGQAKLKIAHRDRSKGDYNIKITLNDGDPDATPAVLPTTLSAAPAATVLLTTWSAATSPLASTPTSWKSSRRPSPLKQRGSGPEPKGFAT